MFIEWKKEGRQLENILAFWMLFKMFIGTVLGGLQSSRCARSPCALLDVQAAHGRRQCSQTCSPRPPLDCFPLILSRFSRARTRRHSNQAVHQGRFIYSFNNGVSWENFGFPFPEAKIHLQNVLEIY